MNRTSLLLFSIGMALTLPGSPVASAAEPIELKPMGFFAEVYGGGHFFLESTEDFEHSGVIGGKVGVKFAPHFGLEFGLGYVQTATLWRPEGVEYGRRVDLINPRLDFVVWMGKGPVVPYLEVGAGVKHFTIAHCTQETLYQTKNPDTDFEFDLGLGVRFLVADWIGFDLGAHYFLSLAPGETLGSADGGLVDDRFDNIELTGGLFVLLGGGPSDRDGDGILDKNDACPDNPEDRDQFDDEDGCPDPDNDQDGILDGADSCPLVAEDRDGFQDQDGCPDPDNDQDGILDINDKCPNEPEDKDNFQDQDGCPDPDNDQDGIVDAEDRCVMEPETRNGFEDRDGCPDEMPKIMEKFSGIIQGIFFELNSDVIRTGSYPILDEAAATLVKFPSIRLEIQGHASSDGDDAKNLDLSQRRANSVMNYLIGKGVEAVRLQAVGFGETRPAYPDTPEERPKNRRVEFRILTQ